MGAIEYIQQSLDLISFLFIHFENMSLSHFRNS
jgi:hypothetical protein